VFAVKPDHCLWEIYGMLEKATLVGLLGFLFPVSAQAIVRESIKPFKHRKAVLKDRW